MSSAMKSAWTFLKFQEDRGLPADVPNKEQIELWTAAEASEVRQNINLVHGPQDDRELGQQSRNQETGEGLGEERTDFLGEPAFSGE